MRCVTRDEKYGEVLTEDVVDDLIAVALILQDNEKVYLDIRKVYLKDGELRPGKGVRLEVDNGMAEDVMLVAQNTLLQIEFEDE